MKIFIPTSLEDAQRFLERTAQTGPMENKGLIQSIKELNASIDKVLEVGANIYRFFEDVIYCFSHPVEFLGALEPWILLVLFAAIILKAIGFDVDKYIVLIVLILALLIIFC